jgi:hypothetical protein
MAVGYCRRVVLGRKYFFPHIFEMVHYFCQQGIPIHIHTHISCISHIQYNMYIYIADCHVLSMVLSLQVSAVDSNRKVYFRYLLMAGRNHYSHLFTSQQTWTLVSLQFFFLFTQSVVGKILGSSKSVKTMLLHCFKLRVHFHPSATVFSYLQPPHTQHTHTHPHAFQQISIIYCMQVST